MTLSPDFDLGWWNAWIILVVYYAASFVPFFAGGNKADARMEGEADLKEAGTGVRTAAIVDHAILMPLTLLYSFFIPLERGNWWLYSGLIISVLAILLAVAASVSFATAPLEEPMTTGAYALSRHPMYLSRVLVFLGLGLAGTSWVFLACAVVDFIVWSLAVPEEEQGMVSKYGMAYEEYMRHSRRWIGLPTA
jgi:protein-S-isoprenylcysteine O-methyltransferase Ste14